LFNERGWIGDPIFLYVYKDVAWCDLGTVRRGNC